MSSYIEYREDAWLLLRSSKPSESVESKPVNHKYIQMGKVIGDAFSCGKELNKK